jgi:hypothetical protein
MTINNNKEDLKQKKQSFVTNRPMMKVHWLWCVEEMRNPNQVQQPSEKSLWLAHERDHGQKSEEEEEKKG